MSELPNWLETGTGVSLLREESRQVAAALESIFGDHFVQIGQWGDPDLFRRFARTRRSVLVGTGAVQGVDMVSDPDSLAIGGDCIDAVLLPHVLETADDPHGILRDVDRILRPDGHLIILGFNPVGWWGVRHYFSRRTFPAGVQRIISDHRLRDWLRLLNYSVNHANFYHFVAPVYRAVSPAELPGEGAAAAGDGRAESLVARMRRWSALAACYIIVARKEGFVVTPIRPAFKRRTRLVGSLVNPTTRNAA